MATAAFFVDDPSSSSSSSSSSPPEEATSASISPSSSSPPSSSSSRSPSCSPESWSFMSGSVISNTHIPFSSTTLRYDLWSVSGFRIHGVGSPNKPTTASSPAEVEAGSGTMPTSPSQRRDSVTIFYSILLDRFDLLASQGRLCPPRLRSALPPAAPAPDLSPSMAIAVDFSGRKSCPHHRWRWIFIQRVPGQTRRGPRRAHGTG